MATVIEQVGIEKRVKGFEWSISRRYLVSGAADQDAALTAAISGAGDMSPGILDSANSKEIHSDETDSERNTFEISLSWKYQLSQSIAGGGVASISTKVRFETVYTALTTTETKPSGAPDTNDIIQGGVSVPVPSLIWSERFVYPASSVSASFLQGVYSASGTVNAGAFRFFSAGEVCFMGIDASPKADSEGNEYWEFLYDFEARPNQTSIAVAGQTIASKLGWQYLEVVSEPSEDATAVREVPDLQGAYVRTVIPTSNFAALYPA